MTKQTKEKKIKAPRKGKFREDEYRFAATKICAMSARLPSDDDIAGLCDLPSVQVLIERIGELGFKSESDVADLEDIISSSLEETYKTLCSFLPDEEITRIMRARFDCHNLKTAAKCSCLGLDPVSYFMKGGVYSFREIVEASEKRDFSAFPPIIAKAAKDAFEAINTNAQARTVDILLDRACFDYMLSCAYALGCPEIFSLLALKTDLTNTLTRLRIFSLKNRETAETLLKDSLLEGGRIPLSKLIEADSAEKIISFVCEDLGQERARLVSQSIAGTSDYDALAAVSDSVFFSEAMDICRRKLVGVYPVIEYIIRYEFAVKNIRIIAGGISSGKSPEIIRSEVRAYV